MEAAVSFYLLLPECALAVLAVVLLVADLLTSDKAKSWLAYLAVAGLVVSAALVLIVGQTPGVSFAGTLAVDALSTVFQLIALAAAAIVILSSIDYLRRRSRYQGEFYALVLFATLGAMFLASGNELITLYVAIELTSISQYVLAGFLKGEQRSSEAGLKYLLLGALSSAVLLYGIALLYGATGTTFLRDVAKALSIGQPSPMALLGVALLIAGFGFKMAVVPFQMWVPDVYQGAPTPTTAFLSVASKAAGFVVVLRVFGVGLQPVGNLWAVAFAGLAAITMTIGNVSALRQTNVKRMMGYSSIGQAGYALTGLAAARHATATGLIFFLIAYAMTNLGAFVAIIYFSNRLASDDLADYAGLSRRSPGMAFVLTVCLLSLVGLPPMVGFWSKVYLFLSVFDVGLVWLVAIGLLNSALAAFYYLKVVHAMYLKPPLVEKSLTVDWSASAVAVVAVSLVVLAGLVPSPFIQAASNAASVLFPQ
jgi:NADH-quinone oxidoreductase subunit N